MLRKSNGQDEVGTYRPSPVSQESVNASTTASRDDSAKGPGVDNKSNLGHLGLLCVGQTDPRGSERPGSRRPLPSIKGLNRITLDDTVNTNPRPTPSRL